MNDLKFTTAGDYMKMNERIFELAKQADEYAEQTVHYYMGQFDGLTWEGKIKQTRDTKFAELIVRECAKIADDGFASSNFGNGITGHQLLKHFGVEE